MKIDLTKYEDKRELFAFLKKNAADIIAFKKSETKFCDVFGATVFEKNIIKSVNKAAQKTTDTDDVIRRTIIGNTYNWLDHHDDVHIEGIFTKSIQENKRILHLHDHLQMVGAKVGIPVNIYEEKALWTDLGVSRLGQTTCLCMDSDIKKYLNESIFYQYKNGEIDQHSVGMQYVKIAMCFNSQDAAYKEDYANWLKYFPLVGNPEKALEHGYFFAVIEAKLKEISAVTEGSNEITPVKTYEAAASTSAEPPKGTPSNALTWDHFKQIKFTN